MTHRDRSEYKIDSSVMAVCKSVTIPGMTGHVRRNTHGRRVNDNMGPYAAAELVKAMIKTGHTVASSKVLVMGLTFKENCPDLRNTRVIDVIRELEEFGCSVDVTDCWADNAEAEHEYGIALVNSPKARDYDALFLAVPHREYAAKSSKELRAYLKDNGVLFDLKGVLPLGEADLRL